MRVAHAPWVRISHWVVTVSVLTLAFTGFVILMAHPRLYWGEAGNDLTPALFELPISRNYQHGGWENNIRTYDIFNQNGWGRSLHFLAAWFLVLPGAMYLVAGVFSGHFRSHIWPRGGEFRLRRIWQDLIVHLRWQIPAATGGPQYGVLQKYAYSAVVFVAVPLMVMTGLAMSPAVTAAFPRLLALFGGFQSARTIHFFTFAALVLFVFVHVVMVVTSGFRRQIRAMTLGE